MTHGCRLNVLEELVPLITQIHELQADLHATFAEVQPIVQSIEVPQDGNIERIKDELSTAKVCIAKHY